MPKQLFPPSKSKLWSQLLPNIYPHYIMQSQSVALSAVLVAHSASHNDYLEREKREGTPQINVHKCAKLMQTGDQSTFSLLFRKSVVPQTPREKKNLAISMHSAFPQSCSTQTNTKIHAVELGPSPLIVLVWNSYSCRQQSGSV